MTTDIEDLANAWIEAWNSHDTDKIAALFADDFIHEDVAIGAVFRSKEELQAGISALFAACPDVKLEQKSLFGTSDWLAQEWVMTGTQTGAFNDLGIPATGKSFSIRGVSIIEVHDGKVARNSDYWSLTSMLQQLGQG